CARGVGAGAGQCGADAVARRETKLSAIGARPGDGDSASSASGGENQRRRARKSQVDLDHCTITSPIDGMVISRNVDVGQTVAASLSAPVIFTIANDLAKMQIDANVAEADVGSIGVD